MLLVLSLPLLAECSLEDSLLAGPESETRRSVTEEIQYEELHIERAINDPLLPGSQYPLATLSTPSRLTTRDYTPVRNGGILFVMSFIKRLLHFDQVFLSRQFLETKYTFFFFLKKRECL